MLYRFFGRCWAGAIPVYLWIILGLGVGCANQISPTGGEGDKIPPEVSRTVPETQSLFVDGNTIKIFFNEAVKKPTYNKELFISPLLSKPPRIYLSDSGKRVKINLAEGLEDSTTYVITLKEVLDFFGNNKLEQVYTFAFSTGGVIDSMEIEGQVQSPLLGKGQEEMILMLFPADSVEGNDFLGKRPYYISQTDESGKFQFKNLRNMPYKIYGLVDVDQSATYSQLTEMIALADTSYILFPDTSNTITTKLYAFLPDEISPKFRSYVWLNDSTWLGEFTEEFLVDSLQVWISDSTGIDSVEILQYTALPGNKNELILTSPLLREDSMQLRVYRLQDSLGNKEDSVITLRASRTREWEAPLVQRPAFNFEEEVQEMYTYWPVQASDTSFIVVTDTTRFREAQSDTVESLPAIADDIPYVNQLPITLEPAGFRTLIHPLSPPDPSKSYILHIRGEALGFEDTVFLYKLTWPDPEEFGTWEGLVQADSFQGPLIIQLMKDKEVVRQVFDSTFAFRFINPGTYQIRVIFDQDGNKTWTPGTPDPYALPERIYLIPSPTTIRANWDIEADTLQAKFDIPIAAPPPDTTTTAAAPSPNRNSRQPSRLPIRRN